MQDPGDQALTSTMESLRSSLQDTRIDEFNRIVKALKMIDEGTYGICVDCELPISEKRLKLYPDATRCLACQEAFEEGKTVRRISFYFDFLKSAIFPYLELCNYF